MNELSLIIDIVGRDQDEAEGRAYSLLCVTSRLLPNRPELTMWKEEDNGYQFQGSEDSLRLLLALAEARQLTTLADTFEELTGLEDGPRTRLSHVASHRA